MPSSYQGFTLLQGADFFWRNLSLSVSYHKSSIHCTYSFCQITVVLRSH